MDRHRRLSPCSQAGRKAPHRPPLAERGSLARAGVPARWSLPAVPLPWPRTQVCGPLPIASICNRVPQCAAVYSRSRVVACSSVQVLSRRTRARLPTWWTSTPHGTLTNIMHEASARLVLASFSSHLAAFLTASFSYMLPFRYMIVGDSGGVNDCWPVDARGCVH